MLTQRNYFQGLAVACALLGAVAARAQDEVYFKGGKVSPWAITEITATQINATNTQNPGVPYKTDRSGVLFVFNRIGNFLVVSLLKDGDPNSQRYKDNFFNRMSDVSGRYDRIITSDNNIITGRITASDESSVTYSDTLGANSSRLPASDIVVVIYANGNHKIFGSPDMAFRVLSAIQQNYNDLAFPPVSDGSTAVAIVPPTSDANSPGDLELTQEQIAEFSQKAIQKAKDFGDYLSEICIKSTDLDQINTIMDRAVSLFIDEDRIIQVSSLTGGKPISRKVKVYMNHLRQLHYDRIVIEWCSVSFVNKFRKGPDGNYWGEIEFEQKFIAYGKDGMKAYGDMSRKKAEVVLRQYTKEVEGKSVTNWDVFLGDIGVTETQAL